MDINYTEYVGCNQTVTNINLPMVPHNHYDIYLMTQFERTISFTAEDGMDVESPHQLIDGGSI
jgi:hypothetical protein